MNAQEAAMKMLDDIRASLEARAMGHEAGGDIVVMQAVDRIVEREGGEGLNGSSKTARSDSDRA